MSFGQAIKMAFKSLKSSKLRTFLTMLGVIIGVSCVALLTTITSGAKEYIVGTLKKESQVVNLMVTSQTKNLSKLSFDEMAAEIDKEITGDFIYTSMAQGSAVAMVDDKFLQIPGETNLNSLYKRTIALGTTVFATDIYYDDVRNIDMVGRFLEQGETDKCTINQEFLNTYYPSGTKAESLIGSTIKLFTDANLIRVSFELPNNVDAEFVLELFDFLVNIKVKGAFLFGSELLGTKIVEVDGKQKVELDANWFENYSGLYLQKNINNAWELYIDFSSFIFTDENIIEVINNAFDSETVPIYLKDIKENVVVSSKNPQNYKTFEIVGVILSESNMLNSMTDVSFITQPNLVEIMRRMDKGSVGILLSQENMQFISSGSFVLDTKGDTTAEQLTPSTYSGISYPSVNSASISIGLFRFDDEKKVEAGVAQIMSAMVTKGFTPDSFLVVSMNTIADMISMIMNIMTIMLSVIAGISLVVGGIGIMNIMLVTVSERTREIGIRKAIGAKKSAILWQFLVEALVVTLIGGIIGILISLIGTLIVGSFMGIKLIMPLWVFALSVGFSLIVGIVFGMYPAIKAAKMHPIDALRHD